MDLDEVAHFEPPHQNLRCWQILLFSSLVLKELTTTCHPVITEALYNALLLVLLLFCYSGQYVWRSFKLVTMKLIRFGK